MTHYDAGKHIRLACDASSYGIGAVISHVMDDGSERPIAMASRTLTKAERGFAQLEKEGLSLIFGVKKFHMYLYGKSFTLITDHLPIVKILGPKTGIPALAEARMQRWSLILSAYDYTIEYRKSADHANADGLSRLPDELAEPGNEVHDMPINLVSFANELPVMVKDISEATRKDPVLSKCYEYTLNGWPNHVTDDILKTFYRRRSELSAEQGCLLWGLRVVIPPCYRERLLNELHEEHHSIVQMKGLARCYLWWPGLDADIEEKIKDCERCQSVRNIPAEAPMHPWISPTRVWQRVHIDFAEKNKQMFLVLIDSHSKWIEVFPMTSTTSTKTIECLRSCFASYGIPEQLVSDNGPQFTSDEFKRFTTTSGIKHTLVPAYHPSSNGAAERSVQILKRRLEKVCDGVQGLLNHRLANFLLLYRSTPHTTTGRSPAELFLKRQPSTRFSCLKPLLAQTVEDKQEIQRQQHDKTASRETRIFHGGDRVGVRSFRGGREKWLWGNITKVCGPHTYVVNVAGARRYVHVDHIICRNATATVESAVIPKPVIVPPALDNEQAQSDRDVYGAPFSHIFTELKIYPIEVHISAIQLEISPIQLKISPNQLKISTIHLEISTIHLEISPNTSYLEISPIQLQISAIR